MWHKLVNKISRRLPLIFVLSQISLVTNAGEANDASYYLNLVNENGARHVVREYLRDWDKWGLVLDQIDSGEKDWIRLAILLRTATDAGKTTSLIVTMAYALPNNPFNVVSAIDNGFEIEDICGFPFIEPEMEFIENHYKRTMQALSSAQERSSLQILDRCMEVLTKQYTRIKK